MLRPYLARWSQHNSARSKRLRISSSTGRVPTCRGGGPSRRKPCRRTAPSSLISGLIPPGSSLGRLAARMLARPGRKRPPHSREPRLPCIPSIFYNLKIILTKINYLVIHTLASVAAANSFRFTSFADPHPLTPVESHLSEKRGGGTPYSSIPPQNAATPFPRLSPRRAILLGIPA